MSVSDGRWHHICITWTTRDGFWEAYQDGERLGTGDNLAPWHPIKPGGVIILGQEQVRRWWGSLAQCVCVLPTWAWSWRRRSKGRSGSEALLTLFPGTSQRHLVHIATHRMLKPTGGQHTWIGGALETGVCSDAACLCSISRRALNSATTAARARLCIFCGFCPRHSCTNCVRLLQVAQCWRPALKQPSLKVQYANTYLHPYHQQDEYQTELIYF